MIRLQVQALLVLCSVGLEFGLTQLQLVTLSTQVLKKHSVQ